MRVREWFVELNLKLDVVSLKSIFFLLFRGFLKGFEEWKYYKV